ncbi:MFS transporter [Plantactinospora sp. GCM10030261]|uniref:MFS transporter n=1 Tax=Plantactinospora sp. GCM10030261 TaxID=3273420 RepID=UPI003621A2EE
MTATTTESVRPARWSRSFSILYAAGLVDTVGIQVSYLAVPVLAVSVLDATPGQVGLLGVLSTAAFLVLGLPAGVWVDRASHRITMVLADLARAVLFASVPVAWWMGLLTIGQLYAVVLLAGVGTVFFDVAAQSYLPSVVGRDRLVAANSLLMGTAATVQIAGRGLGGFLVQAIGAPVAVVLNALTHLAAAGLLGLIRPTAAPPARPHAAGGFAGQLGAGVRHVSGHPLLRPLALSTGMINLTVQMMTIMIPVLFLRDLGLDATALGVFFGVGGVGALLGALTARPLADRIGLGRALWVPGAVVAPLGALIPMAAGTGPRLWLAGVAWLAIAWRTGIGNVVGVSLRQRSTPDAMLGRMNATFRFLLTGALALGSAVAGLLGELTTVRTALWVGAAGAALTWVPIFCSRLRHHREAGP